MDTGVLSEIMSWSPSKKVSSYHAFSIILARHVPVAMVTCLLLFSPLFFVMLEKKGCVRAVLVVTLF